MQAIVSTVYTTLFQQQLLDAMQWLQQPVSCDEAVVPPPPEDSDKTDITVTTQGLSRRVLMRVTVCR